MTTLRKNIAMPDAIDLAIAETAAYMDIGYSELIRTAVVAFIEQFSSTDRPDLRRHIQQTPGRSREVNIDR